MNCIEKQLQWKRRVFIFSLTVFFAFMALSLYSWYSSMVRWQEVQTWQKLPATVVSHKKAASGSGRNRRDYSEITYRYEIDGKAHFGYDSGLGGKNLLPVRFRIPGAKVSCFFDPATGKSMLNYRKDDRWMLLFSILFLSAWIIFTIVSVRKLKQADTRTVPPEFAKHLLPPEGLPQKFTVQKYFLYEIVKEDHLAHRKLFCPEKKSFRALYGIMFFGIVFVILLLVACLDANYGIGVFALIQLVPLYLCLKKRKVFVLDKIYRSLCFTAKPEQEGPIQNAIPFSGVQAFYLVWMTRSDCMGILIQTEQGNIVIGRKDGQLLMSEAAQMADLIDPQLPVYDLIHREFDKKQRQGYILA